jgi:hypothetical protein
MLPVQNIRAVRRMVPLLSLMVFLPGCDDTFSPKAPHEPRLVVYSILNPRSDTQYVRLSITYDVDGFDPKTNVTESIVNGAQVMVTQGNQSFTFSETLVQRIDTSRYRTPIHAYVAAPFALVTGSSLRLDVIAPGFGAVSAEALVPSNASVSVTNGSIMRQLTSSLPTVNIAANIPAHTRGYLLRMYVVYEVLRNGVYETERKEVPRTTIGGTERESIVPIYPKVERRGSEAFRLGSQTETATFDFSAYVFTIQAILREHSGTSVRFRYVYVELVQLDQYLYNYYNIVNGFQDEFSIRTDVPDYTNIQGGIGVFGGFTVDSTTVSLPSSFM